MVEKMAKNSTRGTGRKADTKKDVKESGSELQVVTLSGIVGIEQAGRIRDELIAAFGKAPKVILNLSRLESLDLSIIQLILSARRYADGAGKLLEFTGTLSNDVQARLAASGFCKAPPDDARDLQRYMDALYGKAGEAAAS